MTIDWGIRWASWALPLNVLVRRWWWGGGFVDQGEFPVFLRYSVVGRRTTDGKGDVMTTFVLRTIRKGRVKIGGKWYVSPEHRPDIKGSIAYDGRLDGLRYCFARYRHYGGGTTILWEPFVFLWGSEAASRGYEEPMSGPEVVDGYLPWCFWKEEATP